MCWWPLLRKIFGWKRFLQKSGRGEHGDVEMTERKDSHASSATAVARATPSPVDIRPETAKSYAASDIREMDPLERTNDHEDTQSRTVRVIRIRRD